MRRKLLVRTIIGALSLTLLASGTAIAQRATPPPTEFPPNHSTTVITNGLDPSAMNTLIAQTARGFHVQNGAKPNGFEEVGPLASTDDVVNAAIDAYEERPSVVIISGGDGQANVGLARSSDSTVFIDLGQPLPCLTEDGRPDPSGTCAGGEFAVPFQYTAVDFKVEDGAYLAGLLAAAAASTRNDRLGIISGEPGCGECNRYVRGFVNGARSLNPDVDIELAYLANDEEAAFSDPVSARTFTEIFVDVVQPDVLLPVGRGTSRAMIEAACDAGGVLGIGTGIDVAAANPELADCVLTSVSKDVAAAVDETMYSLANLATQRLVSYDLVDDRIAVTWPRQTLPVGTIELYDAARQGILTGQIDTCPGDCSAPFGAPAEDPEGADAPAGDGGEGSDSTP